MNTTAEILLLFGLIQNATHFDRSINVTLCLLTRHHPPPPRALPPKPSQTHSPMTTGYISKKTSNTWRYEEEDGTEMEYDAAKGIWVPLVDEDLVKRQQAAYSVAGVDEETPAAPVLARENKKRKQPEDYTSATAVSEAGPSIKRGRTDKKEKPPGERKSKNTAVYVTGLPLDTEPDELVERFSKCGVVEEDDEGEPKVKMYAKEDGTFSGEALVVYFKEDSVLLALNILDDAELRFGDPSTVMRVTRADFTHKNSGGGGVNNDPSKPRKTVDKKKASKRIGKMQKKLLEWDDEDGFGPALQPEDSVNVANKNSRVVVLKHMFTLQRLEEGRCSTSRSKGGCAGGMRHIGRSYQRGFKEPEGVMTVKFRDPLSAQACVVKMNGRFFDGLRVEASLYSGKQRFKRSGTGDEIEGDNDEAEKKRLDSFAQWLLTEGD
ncbi:Splicing factor U2AF-associated protein 2 [Mycena venus]|uniref:Splicing factor U2AF-associated protein 2 n=1 Tax=Mycena venus TaxID=2733690 RepID=A0A8H6YMV2_9AGAR|nr:Splicing factor U2AF-associated protein 2 [Mycena venus]